LELVVSNSMRRAALVVFLLSVTAWSTVYGQTAYEISQADTLETYMLNNIDKFPYLSPFNAQSFKFTLANVTQFIQSYNTTSGRFIDLTYSSNTLGNSAFGTAWYFHAMRSAAIMYAVQNSTFSGSSSIYLNQTVADIATQSMTAYTSLSVNLNDMWNFIHTYVDLFENQMIGYVCLVARNVNRLAGSSLVPVASIDSWSNRAIDLFVSKYNSGAFFVSGANMIWSTSGVVLKYLTHSNQTYRIQGLNSTFTWTWNGCELQPGLNDWQSKYNYGSGTVPPISPDWAVGEHGIPYWGG
jgi:hypothetical protein